MQMKNILAGGKKKCFLQKCEREIFPLVFFVRLCLSLFLLLFFSARMSVLRFGKPRLGGISKCPRWKCRWNHREQQKTSIWVRKKWTVRKKSCIEMKRHKGTAQTRRGKSNNATTYWRTMKGKRDEQWMSIKWNHKGNQINHTNA